MTLLYTTTLGLTKHLQSLGSIPSNERISEPNSSIDYEVVGYGNNSKTRFFLTKIGVIEGTYTLFYGNERDELTETTHYTVDLDTSEITLTSAGVTLVDENTIYASYKYNKLELLNSEMTRALEAAENKVHRRTEQRFANYTDTNPGYRQVVNEEILGPDNFSNVVGSDKVYETFFQPVVNLSTTVASDFTLGDTNLVLTSAEGFPTTGTIYVDGNKVSYTGKSTNTLTVPNTTPSIDADSVVKGIVVEISREPEGNPPSFQVLTPDTEFKFDYFTGKLRILSNAFFTELQSEEVRYHSNFLIRTSYMDAWYEKGSTPVVPEDIEEVTYMIASKKFAQRIIRRAHIGNKDNFTSEAQNSGDAEINETLNYYKTLNVGSSPYNKQYLS